MHALKQTTGQKDVEKQICKAVDSREHTFIFGRDGTFKSCETYG